MTEFVVVISGESSEPFTLISIPTESPGVAPLPDIRKLPPTVTSWGLTTTPNPGGAGRTPKPKGIDTKGSGLVARSYRGESGKGRMAGTVKRPPAAPNSSLNELPIVKPSKDTLTIVLRGKPLTDQTPLVPDVPVTEESVSCLIDGSPK